ncbi:MAG: SH3 domain-containing protein [Firmicutes bacterium]|nr:SH3 domain-containing protein [Bacillota bacterium]
MDPKVAVTVLTILLYVFSSNNHKPQDTVTQPPTNVYEMNTIEKTSPEHSIASIDRIQASVKELARLRKGPGTDYPILQRIPAGSEVVIIASVDGWYQISLSDGKVGWIADFLLEGEYLQTLNSTVTAGPPLNNTGNRQKPTEAKHTKRKIVGYYTEDYPGDPTSYGSLLSNGDSLDYIAAFLHSVDINGRISGETSGRAMKIANSEGIKTLALVHNMAQGKFDGKRAHALLQSFNSRARAISDILMILEEQAYDGVNIDLENIDPKDRENLTAFMEELHARLTPHGYLVTMSVPAKTQDHQGQAWVGAFDYYALGKSCDYMMLMTYDEHSPVGGPGPIASFPWVEKVVKYATTQIPKHKVLMGIPAYGYDWNHFTGRASALSYIQVMNRANRMGINPSWDPDAKSPFFSYTDNGAYHEVWFESPDSIRFKLGLVEKYDIGGIAIWKLGYEDDSYWETILSNMR